jgi:uncharacterized membrane protein SirB2
MEVYFMLKQIHVVSIILSGAGFLLRGVWMLIGSPLLGHRLTRVVPHLVDTVLLGSAIGLAVLSQQYPLREAWLTAKVAGLVAYVALGTVALKRGRTRSVRIAALVMALGVFGYIVSVAVTKQPTGFLSAF